MMPDPDARSRRWFRLFRSTRTRALGWFQALWLLVLPSPAVHAADFAGAADFASELLVNHPALLSVADRARLDELNRRLRETAQQVRSLPPGPDRDTAQAGQAAAAGALTRLLEAIPTTVRLAVADPDPDPDPNPNLDHDHALATVLAGPFRLPSDEGGILLRLDGGPGDTRFVLQDLDQARPEHSGTIRLNASQSGTTWVLLGFQHLPVHQSTFPVELVLRNDRILRPTLTVLTPAFGHLRVRLLDDDSGKPTPAMVRITSRVTGRDRRPANVVDFGGQFDGNGWPNANRRANLPGRLGGWWWCVDGPFDLALPPGDYELAVRRGAEHLPVFEPFTIRSAELTGVVARPRRWIDMRKRGWYSGDDHVHGRILGDDDADRLMAWIRAEDIHLANVVKMGDIYRTWFEQRGWGPGFRVRTGDYILSPGQECPRTHDQLGHTLSMNTRAMVRDTDRYFLYDRVADEVHRQGGLFGYAHVNSDLFHVHRDMTLNVPQGRIDFGEVLQFNKLGTEVWYEFLNTGFRFTAAAGSDVPWGGTVGEVRMYAYLGGGRFSADAWFEAVRRGRTFVTSGPMLDFRVDEARPGDELRVDRPDRRLRVRARAWAHSARSPLRRLAIVRHGEVVREIQPADAASTELSLDLRLPAQDGYWIAAVAEAMDGTAGHTTPVYVVRPGLRFWKHAEIEVLLQRRLKVLEEIEELVARARSRERTGTLGADEASRQLARQADALLERVAEARRVYAGLQEIAAAEQALRGQ